VDTMIAMYSIKSELFKDVSDPQLLMKGSSSWSVALSRGKGNWRSDLLPE
jgi:hypothetical protein